MDGLLKIHGVFEETTDGAGGTHAHLQVKLQGVGLGSDTGDSYQLHGDFPELVFEFNRLNENAGGSSNGSRTTASAVAIAGTK